MIRSRPRLSLGTKRANRNSLLRPQAHRRSASEASLALHSPFTQKPRKWLTWTNAPLVQVRCAGRAEQVRRSGRRRNPKTREFLILVCAADPQREGRPGNRSRSDTGGTATRASPSWCSPEIRKTRGYRRPETQFAGLSGERVEYARWLLERALLDGQLIALGMQSIGVHFERMVTDDPEFGAGRANANFGDYHHGLRANVHRSIEFIRRAQPSSVFNRGPKSVESSSQQDLGSGA
jgi:hypothetical protein